MKKINTARTDQRSKVQGQRLTIGLDLGDRSSFYSVLNEAGEVVLEEKLATTPKAMQEVFGRMARSRIALETGMHSPWVVVSAMAILRQQRPDPIRTGQTDDRVLLIALDCFILKPIP